MEKEGVVHDFNGKTTPPKSVVTSEKLMTKKTILIFVGVVLLGVVTGFILAPKQSAVVTVGTNTNVANLPKGTVFGSQNEKAFKDSAEGTLKEGGIEGEGSFHLERPGGVSQNVYLTSSVLDLNQLVGRKVKVWGQTNAAQKAGWLMDVGRAQIVN